MRKIVSRPNPHILPETPLPFHVRSTGYNEGEPGWTELEDRNLKNFVQLFWCVQGTGRFDFNGETVFLNPGEVFFHLPLDEHRHGSVNRRVPWHYYWFTMDGPDAARWMLSYGWKQEVHYAGECPVKLFSELEHLLVRQTPYAAHHALSVALEILALARTGNPKEKTDIVQNFIELIQKYYPDPELTMESISSMLKIHRSTLSRIFQKEMHVSPGYYLDNFRIQKALSLLLETDLMVKEIAAAAGFSQVNHFCEVIRKTTGMTPAEFRKYTSKDSV